MKNQDVAIGIDIGGTKVLLAAVNSDGKILAEKKIATRVHLGPEKIVDDINEQINSIKKEIANQTFSGIGIGMAGQIQADTGIVDFAPNLNWRNVRLKELLEKHTSIKTSVINDVRAATLAEWRFGAGRGESNFICLYVGTGIGGGIVCNDRLYLGHSNTAGEIGHMTVDFKGIRCRCGNIGCMEAYAGGWALANRAQTALRENIDSSKMLLDLAGGKIEDIHAGLVHQAKKNNDLLAIKLLEDAINALSFGCISLVNCFNPSRLILGGGVIETHPEMLIPIKSNIEKHALNAATKQLSVTKSALGNNSGVIGAAAQIFENHKFTTKEN